MARSHDSRIEDALRSAVTAVTYESQGTWSLSLANGASVPARARISDYWLELSAALPEWILSRRDELGWLRVNGYLGGSVRVARTQENSIPHLMVDTLAEHEPDITSRVVSACLELTGALHAIEAWPEGSPPSPFEQGTSRTSVADVERACAETMWPCIVGADEGVRLDVDTRAGVYHARFESSPDGRERVIVVLTDLASQSALSQRAVATLLMAVSGSVRSVKGVVTDRDGATGAALASPVDQPIDRSLNRALSALAVACQICGREVHALRDERLAADYLALWDAGRERNSHRTKEERTCLQQL